MGGVTQTLFYTTQPPHFKTFNKGGYYGKIFIVYGYSSVGKYRVRYDINLRIYRRVIMKINLFGLNKQKENWEEVDRALYQVWCMNQSDVMLPKFMDADFKRCFENIKRKYSYKQICKELKL